MKQFQASKNSNPNVKTHSFKIEENTFHFILSIVIAIAIWSVALPHLFSATLFSKGQHTLFFFKYCFGFLKLLTIAFPFWISILNLQYVYVFSLKLDVYTTGITIFPFQYIYFKIFPLLNCLGFFFDSFWNIDEFVLFLWRNYNFWF